MQRRDFDAGRPLLGHEFGPTACPSARFAAQVVVADFGLVHGHARQAFPRRIELMRLRVWHAAADNDLVQHLKGAGLSLLRSCRAHAMDFPLRLLRSAAHRCTKPAKRTLQSSSYRLHAMKPFSNLPPPRRTTFLALIVGCLYSLLVTTLSCSPGVFK